MENLTTNENFQTKELEKRKQKAIQFLKKPQVWVIALLVVALILGIYIRSLPMTDHGGTPGLWDITTNNWTLGPDLDPWLFLRSAKSVIETGTFPKMDMLRNVPLGFDNSKETMLLPYMIDWTYHLSKIFYSGTTPEFAGAIFPVIMFVLTIISFFLFVREIFIRKSEKSKIKANIISLASAFFMIVIPTFLSRTIAGIPEKESAAFFFMFLTFYFFLKAWKSEKIKNTLTFAILSGIATALMGIIWGGVMFIYIPIALATLIGFLLNKIEKNQYITYSIWLFIAIGISVPLSAKNSLMGMLTSLASGLAFLVFIIITIHFILWNTKLSKKSERILEKIKLPKAIISLIITIILVIIFATIFFGPSFIVEKVKAIHQMTFKPTTGRWNTTVAENRQPDFKEWSSSFGPFLKNIPLMFWLFFVGSIVLFKKMLNKIKNKDAWILTGLFVLLLLGMIFSRYSGASIFNGESFLSKTFYYGAVLLFLGFAARIYLEYYKKGDRSFEKIEFEYIFLFCLYLLAIFSARGAVRLIMVLGPISAIFVSYLCYESINKFFKSKGENKKMLFGIIAILILILSIFTFVSFYKQVKVQSYNMVPSYYNQQWQKAMKWVRDETPQNAVFGHWWDYGYWVQSIGERATVLDGGNAITFWNYWMGRLVLTGDNQNDTLEFLYAHNTTHFLIDSSDIGKYGAFSSIGSDENYDRVSWISYFLLDESQIQETNNQTIYVYTGGTGLDEDLTIEQGGKEIFLPASQTGIGAIVIPFETTEQGIQPSQPYAVMIYKNQQYQVKMRWLSINNEIFVDFKTGIEATAFVFPKVTVAGQGANQNPQGAVMFISPRLMRGMLAQIYILNDPLKNFPNFKLAHTEDNIIIESLENQGMQLGDFIYYQGIQGPIKIWEIDYPEGFSITDETRQKYLDKDSSKYLSWEL